CALLATRSPLEPMNKRSKRAKNINAYVIFMRIKKNKPTSISGARTARHANIPNKAPLAPTAVEYCCFKMKNDHIE
ncbi:MAG: hypothetical protein QSU88_02150, partial [Candidatus Methanoperedens sp.]|nr:hypothetical protein [Candidatus Methanoperedens sp.]